VSTVRNVGGQKAPAQPEPISINNDQEFPVKDAVSESSQLEASGSLCSSQPHSLSFGAPYWVSRMPEAWNQGGARPLTGRVARLRVSRCMGGAA
jgi:hypothetical protein